MNPFPDSDDDHGNLIEGFSVLAAIAAHGPPPFPTDVEGDSVPDEGPNPGNPAHDIFDNMMGNDDDNEANVGDANHRRTTGFPSWMRRNRSPANNTQGPPAPVAPWSILPLSPCCEGGVNVRAAPVVLNATRSRALPPKLYEFPSSKHPKTGMSRLESLPTELICEIADNIGSGAARTAFFMASKQLMVTVGTTNIPRRPQYHERVAMLSLFERDSENLVYCTPCGVMHFPVAFINRDGSLNSVPRACEQSPGLDSPFHKLVCRPLDIRRHMVRWVSNLHGAGKQHLVNIICQKYFREREIRPAPSGGNTTWIETQRDVRVAENTSHVLLRTRHIVSFLDLCHESGGVPTHRSIFYLVHLLKYVIHTRAKDDICVHKAWAYNPDFSTFYQLENELTANPHISGAGGCHIGWCEDGELVKRSLLSRLEPVEGVGRPTRIGGCCLFHEAPCPEAIAACGLPTRGIIKSCEYCYTDFQWDVLYKDEVEGTQKDKPDEDATGSQDGKDHWRERVFVLTTWKNLGRGCECTEHVWDSHSAQSTPTHVPATNATRLPPDFVPIGSRADPDKPPVLSGLRRDEWATDIFRAYERRSALI